MSHERPPEKSLSSVTHRPSHTPGPWQTKQIAGGVVLKQVGGHGKYLFNLVECPGIPEAEANARLIAAAPDMLAALKFADAKLNGWLDADREEEARAAVRAAIAKAEGKDQ